MKKNNRVLSYLSYCCFAALILVSQIGFAQANPSATGTTIQESFFGADFHGHTIWPPTDGLGQVATLGGVRLWDDNIKWGQINTASGVYNWSNVDNWMATAQAQHVDVLYTIADTPKFAGKIPAGSP